MKNTFIILGNGFTIDFLNHYSKAVDVSINDRIDVRNLFRLGDKIKIPWDDKPGFLSYKVCRALWMLGARPGNTMEESTELIEEIITCANMFFDFINEPELKQKRLKLAGERSDLLYLKAYSELIIYLQLLFSHYNTLIKDENLKDFIEREDHWGWLDFFRDLKKTCNYGEITVVTYNYDIWLERILESLGIPYFISGVENNKKGAVEVIKPHGSINFVAKDIAKDFYGIDYHLDFDGLSLEKLGIKQSGINGNSRAVLIPPAGDSSRLGNVAPWSIKLKEKAIKIAKEINHKDDVVLCGLSYWHVDRKEIDELLVNIDQDVEFTFVDPSPPRDLNAVLTSIFKNYVHQSSSSQIGGILHGKTI